VEEEPHCGTTVNSYLFYYLLFFLLNIQQQQLLSPGVTALRQGVGI
jgi:hypothetical protein